MAQLKKSDQALLTHQSFGSPCARLVLSLFHPAIMSAICIVSSKAAGQVDTVVIEQAGGYKVTVSATCSADLIISREGSTVAFLLLDSSKDLADPCSEAWNRQALECLPCFSFREPAGRAHGEEIMRRIARHGSKFDNSFVLVSMSSQCLQTKAAIHSASCRCCSGSCASSLLQHNRSPTVT